MNKTEEAMDRAHSRLLEEVEKFLLSASPTEIKKAIEKMDDMNRIEAAVDRMQNGIARLLETKPSSSHPTFAAAAFAGVHNSPAQNARIRIAFGLALNPSLSREIGYTSNSVFDLADSDVMSLYESLKSESKVP